MKSTRIRIFSALTLILLAGITLAALWVLFINDDSKKSVSDETDNGLVVASYPLSSQLEVNNNGAVSVATLMFNENETVFEALQRLDSENPNVKLQYDEFEFGAFITSIFGATPDPASEFLSFIVNGQDSSVGISDYKLQEGDKIEFVITKFN